MFWDTRTWIATRAAGSGSTPMPDPDLIVGNKKRKLAIECKSGKDTRYLTKKEVDELVEFSDKFGAEPWIGIRFNNMDWFFVKPKDLGVSKGQNYFISKDLAVKKGITFDTLIN
jgi:Holliday junction resolvase